ncbi:MAG: NADH:flavin oxidoreductase, partial [Spirochaetales bacterium]|nr:NADH:flavin oxidoreductase [Spirochaetales bacterium]
MSEFEKFKLKDSSELKAKLAEMGLELPFSSNTAVLGESVDLGRWSLPNRFVVQPMEGIDADPVTSAPSDLTFRRYRRFAEGGAGLIWFEAAVVSKDGKSNP